MTQCIQHAPLSNRATSNKKRPSKRKGRPQTAVISGKKVDLKKPVYMNKEGRIFTDPKESSEVTEIKIGEDGGIIEPTTLIDFKGITGILGEVAKELEGGVQPDDKTPFDAPVIYKDRGNSLYGRFQRPQEDTPGLFNITTAKGIQGHLTSDIVIYKTSELQVVDPFFTTSDLTKLQKEWLISKKFIDATSTWHSSYKNYRYIDPVFKKETISMQQLKFQLALMYAIHEVIQTKKGSEPDLVVSNNPAITISSGLQQLKLAISIGVQLLRTVGDTRFLGYAFRAIDT